jgi:hypothetical protein
MERAKIHPVVIGAAAAVLVSSVLGAAAIAGALTSSRPELAAVPAICARCGPVEAVRAAADETADVNKSTPYRVTVRMDDGSTRERVNNFN